MKKLLAILAVIAAVCVGLYEFAKYPGEKYLMNTWKGKTK